MSLTDAQIGALFGGLCTDPLPPPQPRSPDCAHAPKLQPNLTEYERTLAVRNALRYFPPSCHAELAAEFARELHDYGHIYMYRYMPSHWLSALPLDRIPARSRHAGCIVHMLLNNLDPAVAQYPQELVTYGGNGQVLGNWAQFRLVLHYLTTMSDEQTLVLYSGHPMGLFPSHARAPRAVITNGMMVPNYSQPGDYANQFALGVSMYGQMTAGSYCYIGPQGIVHGTTLTVLNAARKFLSSGDLTGRVFVTSGLGGMSGAQAKAAVIAGCIGVIAEISSTALQKRQAQGWLNESTDSLDECIHRIMTAQQERRAVSIGYLGNVVDLWEKLADLSDASGELLVSLGSDQTSCHNPYAGGYYPVGLTFDESNQLMADNPSMFKEHVQERCVDDKGMYFWDYGNAFLLECERAGADVRPEGPVVSSTVFKYPSYVQDIMGDIFSLGFGPFRWVCTSGEADDLRLTDALAKQVMLRLIDDKQTSEASRAQLRDNLRWIEGAEQHKLVVGSQARILYANQLGRTHIALAFNEAVGDGRLKAPVVLSRDHHDVSGTDSPFRETSNIYDGSAFTADMAVQNCIGDAFRGASWVALHNGGGVGWGEVINGGFGLVLDGTEASAERARSMLHWDVNNGVARRAWAGNANANATIDAAAAAEPRLCVTRAHAASDDVVGKAVQRAFSL